MSLEARTVTRKDVAKAAGVSTSAVSLVLNDNPGVRISPATRQRVREAAAKLGYSPNPVARALAMGVTGNIGVALHYIKNPFNSFTATILDGLWEALHEKESYRCVLGQGHAQCLLGKLYNTSSVDGLVLIAPPIDADDPEFKAALERNFPMVCVGSKPKGAAIDYVDIDNVLAGYQATRRLLDAGHTKILHLAGPLAENSAAVDRQTGYFNALREAGLDPAEMPPIDCSFNGRFAQVAMEKILSTKPAFSAIFAANTAMAYGAQRILLEKGYSVPGDISITSIDRFPSDGILVNDTITRVDLPLHDIGEAAGRRILERIQKTDLPPKRIVIPHTWYEGASIAPAL